MVGNTTAAGNGTLVVGNSTAVVGNLSAAEKAAWERVDPYMGATLLGTVVFMMSVFYLLNHQDEHMRKHSANVVSSTISIFCAVLMFQAINGWFEEKLGVEGWDATSHCAFDCGHMVVWLLFMQVALALRSGALLTDEEKKSEHVELRRLDMKCYATLLAHMTGFAAINAFAQLQHTHIFSESSHMSFTVVPIALASLYALQRVTDYVRERIAAGDGKKDAFESLWDEETEEAENDVFGLAVSFAAAQSIRFWITRSLPDVEGREDKHELESHSLNQKMILFGFAVLFALLTFLSVYEKPEESTEHMEAVAGFIRQDTLRTGARVSLLDQDDREGKILGKGATKEMKKRFLDAIAKDAALDRLWDSISVATSMTTAWCLFFWARWILSEKMPGPWPNVFSDDTEEQQNQTVHYDMLLTLLQALVLSSFSFSLIRALDIMEDSYRGTGHSKTVTEAIQQIIKALGILVGFGWEQCFDTSVASISSQLPHGSDMKLLFAVFVFVVIVPAWKFWILPMDVCMGWKRPALAQIQTKEDLEKFILTLRRDFKEKRQKAEQDEKAEETRDFARLHGDGRHDVTRVHLARRVLNINAADFIPADDPADSDASTP